MNRMRLKECQTRIRYLHPRYKLQEQKQRLAELEDQLRQRMERQLKDDRHRLAIYIETMKGLSPIQKLNQGYSYVENEDKAVVKSIRQIQPGERLSIYVTDGVIHASAKDCVVYPKEERGQSTGK